MKLTNCGDAFQSNQRTTGRKQPKNLIQVKIKIKKMARI